MFPLSLEELAAEFAREPLFNIVAVLDSETGRVADVPEDLIDYCRGRIEGTDLQLNDTFLLPLAQHVADESRWLEEGFDEEGLPFGPADRRFFPLPRLGPIGDEQAQQAAARWLEENDLTSAG